MNPFTALSKHDKNTTTLVVMRIGDMFMGEMLFSPPLSRRGGLYVRPHSTFPSPFMGEGRERVYEIPLLQRGISWGDHEVRKENKKFVKKTHERHETQETHIANFHIPLFSFTLRKERMKMKKISKHKKGTKHTKHTRRRLSVY
jgi:hypothetical protein